MRRFVIENNGEQTGEGVVWSDGYITVRSDPVACYPPGTTRFRFLPGEIRYLDSDIEAKLAAVRAHEETGGKLPSVELVDRLDELARIPGAMDALIDATVASVWTGDAKPSAADTVLAAHFLLLLLILDDRLGPAPGKETR